MFENTGIVPYGLKGEKGDPGDDYILTEEDKEEIIAAIRAVIVVDSDTVNGHTVEADVPEDAVFTDTTYDPATQSSTGLMSAQDKTKLDALQNDALRKTTQTLSAEEKTQARSNIGAIDASIATTKANDAKVLVIESSSFSSLPQTISNSKIGATMVVVNSVLSNPNAQTGDWTATTSSGSVTIAGSISGSTTITLYLEKTQS